MNQNRKMKHLVTITIAVAALASTSSIAWGGPKDLVKDQIGCSSIAYLPVSGVSPSASMVKVPLKITFSVTTTEGKALLARAIAGQITANDKTSLKVVCSECKKQLTSILPKDRGLKISSDSMVLYFFDDLTAEKKTSTTLETICSGT